MKRHECLASLSREHHTGLVEAKRLIAVGKEKGLDPVSAGVRLRGFWESELQRHFREEDEILLPLLARYSSDDEIIIETLIQHVALRRLIDEVLENLEGERAPAAGALREIGERLKEHIRFEESVLLPAVEKALPEGQLVRIKMRLEGH